MKRVRGRGSDVEKQLGDEKSEKLGEPAVIVALSDRSETTKVK